MTGDSSNSSEIRQMVQRLMADFQAKVDENMAQPVELTEEQRLRSDRLMWILRAAYAHAEGCMPWRAKPPTGADAVWCDQVCYAVRDKRARPEHPDPDIEQLLLNAFPT
ncbi:MAG TPA: hypothetical protein VFP68_06700 [Burkholderiaceae bacterium]|nr:hypothetical protein [Burkholderiaceae bacterium]